MSSKFLFIMIFLFGCGVKGDPVSPKNPPEESLMDHYPDIQLDKSLDEHKRQRR